MKRTPLALKAFEEKKVDRVITKPTNITDVNSMLKCPVCDLECNHFVYTDSSKEADIKSVPLIEDYYADERCSGKSGTREKTVVLFFYCENNHRWELHITFHEGNIFAQSIYRGESGQILDDLSKEELIEMCKHLSKEKLMEICKKEIQKLGT